VYVALLSLLGKKAETVWKQAFALVFAAAAKFLTLYFTVVQLLLPALASALKAPQIKTFTMMFSWPQLVTALLGGALALLVIPVLKRAMKNPGR
jgi:ABC-type Co2+ transport system permease subunit